MSDLIYTNEDLTKNLKLANNLGYKFVIKAQDILKIKSSCKI